MNCKTTLGLLSAYLDRELGPEERNAIRAHLVDCESCRREERDLRALKGLLLGVRAPEPAADFEQRLMRRLYEEAKVPVRSGLKLPSLRPLVWGQIGGLAGAAMLAWVVLIGTPVSHPTPTLPVRTGGSVARNVDYDASTDRYEAYARADDFAGGTSLLTTSTDAP